MSIVVVALVLLLLASCRAAPQVKSAAIPGKILHVEEITIAQIHLGLRTNSFTCEELVATYLDRIKRYDKPTKLNAIVYINPNALKKARDLDTEWKRDKSLRELHCVPIILKDNFDTGDMPTTAGSNVLKSSIPPDDAFMVRRLREAGALILAKSNMAEWAFSPYFTISGTAGETLNPYDLSRVPAGSSGGTAAAIAANFGAVGMGTDTGNSIRGPASHTSLVGIRATIGVTSRDGIVPLLSNRDVAGPITRTVTDAAKVFNVIAGYDPADPLTHSAIRRLPPDYTRYLRRDGLKGARIGVLRDLSNPPTADPGIKLLFEKAINKIRQLGAKIVDPLNIPNFQKHRSANGFCSAFRWDVQKYFASLGDKAPVTDFMDVIRSKNYLPSSQWAIDWVLSAKQPPAQQTPPCLGVDTDPRRKAYLTAVLSSMNRYHIDAIIYPTWSNPPRKVGDLSSPHGNNSPVIAPHTGQPAITVPMGFTRGGLPAGLQILGKPFSEQLLFQYAFAYEQATLHRKPPRLFSEQ